MKVLSYGAAGVLAASLWSTAALANPKGLSGYSGKQSAAVTCSACHTPNGATAPTVEISGPATLAAGETGQYSVIITGGPAKVGGTNIAVSNTMARLAPANNSGLTLVSGELAHSAPKAFSGNKVQFDFSVTAPGSAGTLTLFAAGNSANGNQDNRDGGLTGDGIATTKREVTITAAGGGTNPPPGTEEPAGGCSSTGGAPALIFVLAAAGVTLLRRRHG